MFGTIRLAPWQEGPTGSGQGGLSSYLFSETVGHDLSVRLHAPIPLDVDLIVGQDADGRYTVTHPAADTASEDHGTLILSGRPTPFDAPSTPPVSVAEARAARGRTEVHVGIHAAPNCFSCGINQRSMGVHPGELDDGRFATDLTPPSWTLTDEGKVDPSVFWAALDCTAGVFVGSTLDEQKVVTANYQAEMHRRQIEPGPFAIVAFAIDEVWDGRKRWAASAAFDAAGELVAEATSLWIRV